MDSFLNEGKLDRINWIDGILHRLRRKKNTYQEDTRVYLDLFPPPGGLN